jgi:hypothetical protein
MEMEWVPCAERMPPEYATCIVGRPDVPWPITAFWTGQKWCRDVMKDEFHVTHWMPMPPPPSNAKVSGERSESAGLPGYAGDNNGG